MDVVFILCEMLKLLWGREMKMNWRMEIIKSNSRLSVC